MLPWHLKLEGSQRSKAQGLSFPILLLWIKSASQTMLLITETKHSSCVPLNSKLQIPANLHNYANSQSHPPIGTSSHSRFLTLQRPPLKATVCPVCLQVQFYVILQNTESSFPKLWVYVTNKCCPSSVTIVECPVFSHPHIPRARNPPLPIGWKRGKPLGSKVISNYNNSTKVLSWEFGHLSYSVKSGFNPKCKAKLTPSLKESFFFLPFFFFLTQSQTR